SASRNGVNTLREKSRWRVESAPVMGGPSLFHTSDGTRVMTHAPLTRRRYGAKLSGVLASMRTTGPATVAPPVPGAHAQLAAAPVVSTVRSWPAAEAGWAHRAAKAAAAATIEERFTAGDRPTAAAESAARP